MDAERALVIARLARWLGPWASESRRPRRVLRRCVRVDAGVPFVAWVYRPTREPVGALLVVPGLHYLGPADPRLDRFLAILAHAGFVALCPFLPELRALRVGPSLVPHTAAAFDALRALPEVPRDARPGVFSISFGSYPALHLAASHDAVGALVIFGGYASFEDVIRFSLEGNPDRPHDPLNRPVVFLNLLDHLDGVPADPEPLRRAWITFVRRTWGRPAMKERAAFEPIARSIAARLPEGSRELFAIGTGLSEGGVELVRAALERARPSLAHLDARPICGRIRAPITIVHGRDDDVIPHTHAAMLAQAMPAHARVLTTGLYAHTGHGMPHPGALAAEVRTLAAILEAIADAGRWHR
jgi:pimeloyl-ACP methyl ester carboxylesterase